MVVAVTQRASPASFTNLLTATDDLDRSAKTKASKKLSVRQGVQIPRTRFKRLVTEIQGYMQDEGALQMVWKLDPEPYVALQTAAESFSGFSVDKFKSFVFARLNSNRNRSTNTVDMHNNWVNHKIMILIALSCSILYWLLLWYLSCKSLHKSNMLDIYSACESGSVTEVRSVMRRLTNSPAVCLNVNSPDVDGNTPLMLAAGKGHADVCALLIKEGARVDVRRFKDNRKLRTFTVPALRRRWTALHLAAARGHLKVVQVLLEGAGLLNSARPSSPAAAGQELDGVAIGFRDIVGQTPLHIAARHGYPLICCFLAHHVPSWKDVMDINNCRPVDVAWSGEVSEAISTPSTELLTEAGGELARVPLLPGAAAVSGEEAWPQVQLAIARSSAKEQLLAPGLCSYIASSCGGALGRVFLTHAEPNELDQHGVSVLTDISEGSEVSSSFSLAALPVLDSNPPDAPSMGDLCPVNPQQQPVEWWLKMAQDSSPTPASASTSRGSIFARLPPESILGEGSYGVVWRALDRQTKKLYAVKNIRQKQNTSDVSRREFEVADHIRMKPHPCIVQLFLVHNYQDAGLYVLVMELCPGGDLLGRIKASRNRLGPRRYEAPPQAIPWIAQVFLGLEHMHKRMLTLLRDLKPENVVLSSEGCAKLTDFGFGRFGVESVGIWSFGVPTGSPGYVAPEVLAQQTYDYRADLYSLGVLVWVLLTGGLLNKADPLPPMGKMRYAGDFQAHLKDCEMLKRCLEQPESNGARRMRPMEQDFVAKLIPRQPLERLCHQDIREHPLLNGQLPTYSATWAEVTTWTRAQGGAAAAGA
ncbi:Hunk [Symbiodinium sp. CCMP2592]|nr:Hunk [Symbiodinium sp. CCMP2592]